MSMGAGRRAGFALLLGFLGVALLSTVLPGDPGAIQLGGVGLLWWFAVVAAPVAATLVAAVLTRPAPDAPSAGLELGAVWVAPVVLVSVAGRVFAGAADAPVVALATFLAPLLALLAGPAAAALPPSRVASLATLAGAGLALWASATALADVAEALSLRRWQAAVLAAALALLVSEWRPSNPGARLPLGPLLGGAVAAFTLPVVVVGAALGASPWTAWSRAASAPAFTFGERSAWVTEGRRLREPTTFAFTEAHRVTAVSPGTYRVIEQVGSARVTREWRLGAGDALTLRPGDRLVLDAGAHVRFEAGRRVPGAPVSGVVWADPPERRSPQAAVHALGAALTLVGGALALSSPPGSLVTRGASSAPALLLASVLSAVCWGVYGAHAAPELAIGGRALAGLFELPAVVRPSLTGRLLVAVGGLALLLAFVAAACALRGVVRAAAAAAGREARAPMVWVALLVAATAASVAPASAWGTFLAGCGLAAAAGAPRLAGGGRAARLAGSLVGVAAFAALWAGAGRLPAWAAAAGAYPVLVAGPLAWLTSRAGRVAGATRG